MQRAFRPDLGSHEALGSRPESHQEELARTQFGEA
ncbi:MAG: hypothetical protein QOI12_3097, partial [Alphaproteobacteria bacterium]|nr:hypothetical protein [Alphaproteobacteria bacterium]